MDSFFNLLKNRCNAACTGNQTWNSRLNHVSWPIRRHPLRTTSILKLLLRASYLIAYLHWIRLTETRQSTRSCLYFQEQMNFPGKGIQTRDLPSLFISSSTFLPRRAGCPSPSGSWPSSTRSSSRCGSRWTWGSRSTRRCWPARSSNPTPSWCGGTTPPSATSSTSEWHLSLCTTLPVACRLKFGIILSCNSDLLEWAMPAAAAALALMPPSKKC